MADTITTVLTNHQQKSVNTQKGPGVVHEFDADNGMRLATFSQDIANHAHLLQGAPVEVVYSTRRKGEYVNYTLLGVQPADGNSPTAAKSAETVAKTTPPLSEEQKKKEIRIMRQSAAKVAVKIIGWLPEGHTDKTVDSVIVVSERLLRYFPGGPSALVEKPVEKAPEPVPPLPANDGIPF